MSPDEQTSKAIIANIKKIAQHQVKVTSQHASCAADASEFQAALQELAKNNPWAVKQYFDDTAGINLYIEQRHIVGYGTPHKWPGYTADADFQNYIEGLAKSQISQCEKRSR